MWGEARMTPVLNVLLCIGHHSLSSPIKNDLTQTNSNAEVEKLYSRAPLSLILTQRIGTNSISCLSTDKETKSTGITVIWDYLPEYLPRVESRGEYSKRGCNGSQAMTSCLSLVVMLLSGTFSVFFLLLFDESSTGLESLTYSVFSALLFTN